jgi:hypothetical protein
MAHMNVYDQIETSLEANADRFPEPLRNKMVLASDIVVEE